MKHSGEFPSLSVNGAVLRGFLRLGVKNVLKFKFNAFSRAQNTPWTSREGNLIK